MGRGPVAVLWAASDGESLRGGPVRGGKPGMNDFSKPRYDPAALETELAARMRDDAYRGEFEAYLPLAQELIDAEDFADADVAEEAAKWLAHLKAAESQKLYGEELWTSLVAATEVALVREMVVRKCLMNRRGDKYAWLKEEVGAQKLREFLQSRLLDARMKAVREADPVGREITDLLYTEGHQRLNRALLPLAEHSVAAEKFVDSEAGTLAGYWLAHATAVRLADEGGEWQGRILERMDGELLRACQQETESRHPPKRRAVKRVEDRPGTAEDADRLAKTLLARFMGAVNEIRNAGESASDRHG